MGNGSAAFAPAAIRFLSVAAMLVAVAAVAFFFLSLPLSESEPEPKVKDGYVRVVKEVHVFGGRVHGVEYEWIPVPTKREEDRR